MEKTIEIESELAPNFFRIYSFLRAAFVVLPKAPAAVEV